MTAGQLILANEPAVIVSTLAAYTEPVITATINPCVYIFEERIPAISNINFDDACISIQGKRPRTHRTYRHVPFYRGLRRYSR